jgi:hypothetical protein
MEAIKDLKKMVATVTDTYKQVSIGQANYLDVSTEWMNYSGLKCMHVIFWLKMHACNILH